jgi:hypothetical protein
MKTLKTCLLLCKRMYLAEWLWLISIIKCWKLTVSFKEGFRPSTLLSLKTKQKRSRIQSTWMRVSRNYLCDPLHNSYIHYLYLYHYALYYKLLFIFPLCIKIIRTWISQMESLISNRCYNRVTSNCNRVNQRDSCKRLTTHSFTSRNNNNNNRTYKTNNRCTNSNNSICNSSNNRQSNCNSNSNRRSSNSNCSSNNNRLFNKTYSTYHFNSLMYNNKTSN